MKKMKKEGKKERRNGGRQGRKREEGGQASELKIPIQN